MAVKGNRYGSYAFQDYIDPSMLWVDKSYSTIMELSGQTFGYYEGTKEEPHIWFDVENWKKAAVFVPTGRSALFMIQSNH